LDDLLGDLDVQLEEPEVAISALRQAAPLALAADAPAGPGDDRDPPVQTCHASSPSRVPITGIFFWN